MRVAHQTRSTSHEEITPMTTRDDASALVQRMQECFNTRQFDQADDLFTPGYLNHPLGATGFEARKDVWRKVVAQFPDMRRTPRPRQARKSLRTQPAVDVRDGVVEVGPARARRERSPCLDHPSLPTFGDTGHLRRRTAMSGR
jgi:hypothetical protein